MKKSLLTGLTALILSSQVNAEDIIAQEKLQNRTKHELDVGVVSGDIGVEDYSKNISSNADLSSIKVKLYASFFNRLSYPILDKPAYLCECITLPEKLPGYFDLDVVLAVPKNDVNIRYVGDVNIYLISKTDRGTSLSGNYLLELDN